MVLRKRSTYIPTLKPYVRLDDAGFAAFVRRDDGCERYATPWVILGDAMRPLLHPLLLRTTAIVAILGEMLDGHTLCMNKL
jgi:hypothetical protein